MNNFSLDFDCFFILLSDVFCRLNHSGIEYDIKSIDSQIKLLIHEEPNFVTCNLDLLWEIISQTKNNDTIRILEEQINDYIIDFSHNPLKYKKESSIYLYAIFFFVQLLKKERRKIENEEFSLDLFIPHFFYTARQKLNHTLLFHELMKHYGVDCSNNLFSLIEREAGIDIYGVNVEDINNFINFGISNQFISACAESILHSMCFDFPSKKERKRIVVLLFAFVTVLKEKMYDLSDKPEMEFCEINRITKMAIHCFPSFCTNMIYYGYQINHLCASGAGKSYGANIHPELK